MNNHTFKSFVCALAALGMLLITGPGSATAAEKAHPAVRYMQLAARDLMAAQRRGTISSFAAVIHKRADVPSIAIYSLGRYRSDLQRSKRSLYYRGVRRFMSRYFADQSRKYQVVAASVDPAVRPRGKDVLVNSRVKLATGSEYSVVWQLAKRRGSYRIVDVKVLGFSLTYLQRGIFQTYLKKRDGNVNALVAALNR